MIKKLNNAFPLFGNIDQLVLDMKPRALVDKDKISFVLRQSELKEIFQAHNLNPDKYTLFNNNDIDYTELTPLLIHLLQTHETRLNNLAA